MMSLRETSLAEVSLKQYFFKLKASTGIFMGLIVMQIVALLSSLGGSASMVSGNGDINVSLWNYSGDVFIYMTSISVFLIAVTVTRTHSRNMDFALVTNRLSSSLSSIGLLLTVCVFGGFTSALLGVPLREVIYITVDRSQIVSDGFYVALGDLLFGSAAAVLYMVLVAASGYFLGVLAKVNIALVLILSAVIIGLMRVKSEYVQAVYDFFTMETSFLLFVLKVVFAAVVLFGLSILVSDRMEARR